MTRPFSNPRSLFLRVLRTACFSLFVFSFATLSAFAADIKAVLDSSDGSSGFAVQNQSASTVGAITSTGNLSLSGNVGVGSGAGTLLGVDNSIYPTASSAYLNLLGGARNARISIGDSDIHFATGNAAEKVTITSTGNLGINSTTPGSKLDVKGGALRVLNGTSAPSVDLATPAGSLYIQNNLEVDGDVYLGDAITDNLKIMGTLSLSGSTGYDGAVVITTTDPAALLVRTSGHVSVFNVDSQNALVAVSGNLGVGTTAPVQALEVRGNMLTDSTLYAVDARLSGAATVSGLTHTGTLESDGVIYGHTQVGVGVAVPASALDVRTSGGVRIWDGALGAGPNQLTHATGSYDLYVKGALEVDGDVYLGDAVTDNLTVTGALVLSGDTNYNSPMTITTNSLTAFRVRQTSSTIPALTVDTTNGFIGIGVTTPTVKLDVDGAIYANGDFTAGTVVKDHPTASPDLFVQGNIETDTDIYGVNATLTGHGDVAGYLAVGATTTRTHATGVGSMYVQNTLEVDGDVYLGDATTDNLTIMGTLNLSGDTAYNGPVSISTTHANALLVRKADGTNIFNVDTDDTGTEQFTMTGNASISGISTLTGAVNAGADLTVGTVTKDFTTGTPDLFVQGSIETDAGIYGATAALTSNLTVGGTASVTGTSTLTGAVTTGADLTVGTPVPTYPTGTPDVFVQGNIETDANIYGVNAALSGNTDVTGRVAVGSTATRTHAVNAGDVFIQNTLEVDGDVYLGDATTDNLTIMGTLNLSGDTSYTGPITISTTHPNAFLVRKANGTNIFNVDTDDTGTEQFTMTGNASISGTSTLTGAVNAGADLTVGTVTKDFTSGSPDLFVQGSIETDAGIYGATAALTSNLTVGGTASVTGTSTLTGAVTTGADVTVGAPVPTYPTGTPDVFVQGNIETDANIYGVNASLSGNADVTGRVAVGSTATRGHAVNAGDVFIQNNLEVDGDVYLGDATTDNLTIMGTLNLSGDTAYNGPITISTTHPNAFLVRKANGTNIFNVDTDDTGTEQFTMTGNASISGISTLTGAVNAGADVTVGTVTKDFTTGTPDLFVQGSIETDAGIYGATAALTSNLSVGGTASVTGTSTLTGAVTTGADVTVGTVVKDFTTGNPDLFVQGNIETDTDIYGVNATLTGHGDVAGYLAVGATTTRTHATGVGSMYVQNTLEVDGDVYLGDATTDNLTIMGTLNLSGDTAYNGPITISTTHPNALLVRKANGTNIFNVDTDDTGTEQLTMTGNANVSGISTLTGAVNAGADLTVGTVVKDFTTGAPDLFVQGSIETDAGIYGATAALTSNLSVGGSASVTGTSTLTGVVTTGADVIVGAPVLTYPTGAPDLFVQGSIETDANIYGVNATLSGNAAVTGNADVTGRVAIGNTATRGHAVNAGDLYIQNTLEVDGDVYLGDATTDNLTIMGTLNLAGDTAYTGPITISTTHPNAFLVRKANGTNIFNVDTDDTGTEQFTMTGNASISGISTLNGAVNTGADVTVGTVTKDFATGSPDLFVQGSIETDAGIYGATASLTSNLAVGGNASVTGTSTLTGAVTTSADITAGTVVKDFATGNPDLFVQGSIETDAGIYGATAALTSNLAVGGNASVTGTSSLTGAVTTGADITVGTVVKDFATGNPDLFVQGSIETDAGIYGATAALTSNLTVGGNASITGTSILTGAVTTGADVTVGAPVPTYPTGSPDLFVQGTIETDANIYGVNAALTGTLDTAADLTVGTVVKNFATGNPDLFVQGNIETDADIYGGKAAFTGDVTLGSAAATHPSADQDMFIKGNLEVDGVLYGDGSGLTGLPGSITGLTPYAMPRASSATNIVDSGIYADASGNLGIGFSAPTSKLDVNGRAAIGNGSRSGLSSWPLYISSSDGLGWKVTDGAGLTKFELYVGNGGLNEMRLFNSVKLVGYAQDLTLESSTGNVLLSPSSGNVGVGTTAPTAKMEVVGTGTATGVAFQIDDGLYAPKVTVLDNGNVGIGSSSPGHLLDLKGNALLGFYKSDNTYLGLMGDAGSVVTNGGASDFGIAARSSNLLFATSGAVERMRISTAGNIGIGTTSPASKLDVFAGAARILTDGSPTVTYATQPGDLYVQNNLEVDGNVYLGDAIADSLTVAGTLTLGNNLNLTGNIGINTTEPAANLEIVRTPATQAPLMVSSAGGAAGDMLVVTSSGNAGIGTTLPTQKLQVKGYISLQNGGYIANNVANDVFSFHGSGGSFATGYFKSMGVGGAYQATLPSNGLYVQGNIGVGTTAPSAKFELVGVGSTTGTAFQIDDSLYAPKVTVLDNGNVGIGSTVPVATFQVGNNPTVVAGSTPVAAIKGNLIVDGKLYGDGGGLTNVPGALSGLNATRVPVASGANTLVDSGIYDVGGNVGIGSTLPGAALDVNGTIQISGGQFSMRPLGMYVGSTRAIYSMNSNPFINGGTLLSLGVADHEAIRISSAANVGIGTSTPMAKLEVVGTGSTTGTAFQIDDSLYNPKVTVLDNGNVGVGTTVPLAGLQVGAGASTLGATLDSTGVLIKGNLEVDGKLYGDGSGLTNITGSLSGLTGSAGYGKLPRASSANTLVDSSLYQNVTGCIGIGTTSPGETFTVKAVDASLGIYNSNAVNVYGFLRNTYNNFYFGISSSGTYYNRLAISTGGVIGSVTNTGASAAIFRNVLDNGSGVAYFTGGNVGVGTIAPLAKLEVVGSGSSTGVAFMIDDNLYNPRMAVLDNGNVGVGTTVPLAGLQVGAGASTLGATLDSTGVLIKGNLEVDGKLYGDGSGLTGITSSQWTGTPGNAIYYNSNNVGIGSSVPRARLEVDGTIYAGGDVTLGNASQAHATSSEDIFVRGNISTDSEIYGTNAYLSGNVGIGTAIVDASYTPRMQITATELQINLQ